MSLSVVVPIHRIQENEARAKALRHVLSRAREGLKPARLVLAEQVAPGGVPWPDCRGMVDSHVVVEREDEAYCKAACLNAGARAAGTGVLLLLDADICLDWAAVRAQANALPLGTVCKPFSVVRRLPPDATVRALAGAPMTGPSDLETTSVLGGGALLIHAEDYWRAGGYDELYVGWGVEDEAFGRACLANLRATRIERPAYHLDHGRDRPALLASEHYRRNRQRFQTTVPTVARLAVVACTWGTDRSRRAAIDSAMASWSQANALPALFVLVEAREEGRDSAFPSFAPAVPVVRIDLRPPANPAWLKESLWQQATDRLLREHPEIETVLYLDSDVRIPSSQSYFAKVADALRAHDVLQPFATVTDTGGDRSSRIGLVANIRKHGRYTGTPGFAFAATAAFLQRMGPFPLCPTCAGDAVLWNRLLHVPGRAAVYEQASAFRRTARFDAVVPRPSVGYVDLPVEHVHHGAFADRFYDEQAALLEYSSASVDEHVCLVDGLAAFPSVPYSSAMAAALQDIRSGSLRGKRAVRDAWDAALRCRLAPLPDSSPVAVVAVLRSGGTYGPQHVVWLRDQIAAHLRTPHRFLCLADCDVPGVEVRPMLHALPVTRSKLELFRADLWQDGESILFLDLDSVVLRDFQLPACPPGVMHYVRESDRRSAWPAWNSSAMYLRWEAAFAHVLDRYLEDRDSGRQPEWMFAGEQEFQASAIHHLRIAEIRDIERLLCVRFHDRFAKPGPPPEEAHVITWATPHAKPWDVPLPWVPPLPVLGDTQQAGAFGDDGLEGGDELGFLPFLSAGPDQVCSCAPAEPLAHGCPPWNGCCDCGG